MTTNSARNSSGGDVDAFDGLRTRLLDYGLLFLRIGAAVFIWTFHMSRKLGNIPKELHEFPDPLGIGHAPSFVMAVGAEGLCSILVAIGIATRIVSIPIVLTMMMVLVLGARGFEGADVQSALLYALPYLTLILTGPGRWSFDHGLWPRLRPVLERYMRRFTSSASY